ncbi:MAG: YiiX/YebB-like N1pC/P60 family cysteine hydrolase [Acidobacteriota bacterium]
MWTLDASEILHLRNRLAAFVGCADDCHALTPPAAPHNPYSMPRKSKERWWALWQGALDCTLALDGAVSQHAQWIRMRQGVRRAVAFRLFLAAFQAQYRFALGFIAAVEQEPRLDPVLNDAVPEMGLPAGTYDAYKFRFLNVGRGTEFALLQAVAPTFGLGRNRALMDVIREDAEALWGMGRGQGTKLTARNALAVLRKSAVQAWFPIQRGVSLQLSRMRLPVRDGWLIRPEQVEALVGRLQPGDILLQRREWAFTNLGLPGFWTHSALYIGTPEERKVLGTDPETRDWLRREMKQDGDLECCLSGSYGDSYAQCLGKLEDGHAVRIIEALGPGVILNSLQTSCECDGLAVLRPRLRPVEKAAAVVRAFHYLGRPYDFQFNFATDSAVVCSELVAKGYEPAGGLKGLVMPVMEIAGHTVTPPNTFARLYDEQAGSSERQFDLVVFLDGNEGAGRASEAGPEEFRESWKRPKWHVFGQLSP